MIALGRYLAMDGRLKIQSAHCPDWYGLLQAAKYLGVAPWELLEQSVWWRDKAIIAMNAEAHARKVLADRKPQR